MSFQNCSVETPTCVKLGRARGMKLGEVGRRKLEPPIKEGMLTDMPDGLKIVYGENVQKGTDETPNVRI